MLVATADEGFPALRRRPTSSHHVLGNGRLRDLNADLEQFTMDTWRAPQRVLATDPSNETFGRKCRSTDQPPLLPTPEHAKATAMPAKQGLWLENDRCVDQGREQPVEADEDQTICGLQRGWAGGHRLKIMSCCRK